MSLGLVFLLKVTRDGNDGKPSKLKAVEQASLLGQVNGGKRILSSGNNWAGKPPPESVVRVSRPFESCSMMDGIVVIFLEAK